MGLLSHVFPSRPNTPEFPPSLFHHHHHHHVASKKLGHLLTPSSLTHPEVSSVVFLGSFCLLGCRKARWISWFQQWPNHVIPTITLNTIVVLISSDALLTSSPMTWCEECLWISVYLPNLVYLMENLKHLFFFLLLFQSRQ
jgi:hypothetical protein